MQLTQITSIVISENRQRQIREAEHMPELVESIRKSGLMHAPVMREEGGKLILVAGETRLQSITHMHFMRMPVLYNGEVIPEGMIPYVTLGQLDPLAAEEAELEENTKRKDLNWQDKAAVVAKLHALRGKQAQAQGRVHTVSDTAAEITGQSGGGSRERVRQDILLAQHLNNPLIHKAASSAEAFKILQREERTATNLKLAAALGTSFTSSVHELYNTDCLSWMMTCEPGTFDVILTDPPYGMGAGDFGDGGGSRLTNNQHKYDDSPASWLTLMSTWAPLSYKVCKEQAHAYVFCDIDHFHELKSLMESAGWYVFRTPMLHYKPNSGRVPLPEHGPRRQWEAILYAMKGKKKTTGIYPDVIMSSADQGLQHGAQKPVSVYSDLLRRSVKPGDVVGDFFAGSGTIFPAAHQAKCKAIGIEANPEYFAICQQRIASIATPEQEAQGTSLLNQLLGKSNG